MPEPALMSAWSSENIDQVSDAGVPNDSALPLDRMPKEEDYEPSMLSKAILSLQEYKQESPLNTGRYSEPKAERPGIRNMAQSAYARVLDDFVGDPYLTDSTARNAQVSARRPSSRRQVDYDRMMYKGQITYRPGTDVLRTSTTEPDELNWDAVSHTASFILHGIQEWVTNNGIDEMGEEYRYPVAYPASRCQTPVSVGVLRKVASVWDSVKPNMTLASLLNQGRHAPEDPPKTVRSDDHYWTRGTSDVEYLSNDSSEGELDYLGCLDLGCEGHKKKLAGCLSTGGEFLRELSPKNIRRFGAPERLTSVPEDRPLSQNAFPLIPPMTRCPPSHPPRNSTRMPQSMPPVLVDEHTLRRASRSHVYLELRAFQNLEVVQEVSLTMGQFCYKGSSFSILRIPMKSADLRRELLVLHMTICTTTESRHPLTLHGVLPLETPMDSTSCTSYEKWIPFMKAPIKDVEQLDFHDICSYQDRAVNQASALVFVRIFIVLSGLIEVPSAMGDMCTVYVADIRDPLDIEVANFCLENPSAVGCIMRCGPPGEYLVNGQICQVFERSSSLWVREGGAQLLLTDYLNGLTSSIEWVPLVSSAAPELMEPVFLPDNTPWECKQDPSKALELAMYRESVRKALLAWQTGDTLHDEVFAALRPPCFIMEDGDLPSRVAYVWSSPLFNDMTLTVVTDENIAAILELHNMYGLVPSAECQRPPTECQRAEVVQEDSVTVHSVKEPEPQDYVLPEPQDYVLPPPSVAAETGVHGHWDYYKPLEAAYVEGMPMGRAAEDDFERWNQFYKQHPGTFECAPEQSRPSVQEDSERYSENFYSPNDLDDDFVPTVPAFVVNYELPDAAYAEEGVPAQEDWQLSPPEFSRPAFPEFLYQRDDESEGSCELREQEAFEHRLLEQEQIYKQQVFLQQLQEEDEANKSRLPYCCAPTTGNTQSLNTTQHIQPVPEPETVEESQRDSTASLSSLPAVSTELAPASLAEIAPPGTDVYCLTNANHRTIELIRRPKFVKRSRREALETELEVRSPEVDMDHEWNEFMEIMESTDKNMKDWVTQPESTQVPSMGSFHVPELLPPDARAT